MKSEKNEKMLQLKKSRLSNIKRKKTMATNEI